MFPLYEEGDMHRLTLSMASFISGELVKDLWRMTDGSNTCFSYLDRGHFEAGVEICEFFVDIGSMKKRLESTGPQSHPCSRFNFSLELSESARAKPNGMLVLGVLQSMSKPTQCLLSRLLNGRNLREHHLQAIEDFFFELHRLLA
ncbi:MAG: hypothetical protein V4473_01515 [Patescibacteria group bacterium]